MKSGYSAVKDWARDAISQSKVTVFFGFFRILNVFVSFLLLYLPSMAFANPSPHVAALDQHGNAHFRNMTLEHGEGKTKYKGYPALMTMMTMEAGRKNGTAIIFADTGNTILDVQGHFFIVKKQIVLFLECSFERAKIVLFML